MLDRDWHVAESTDHAGELRIDGRQLRAGDRVKLHPRARGDVFDIALDGQAALVESVQQDFEGNFHVVVLVDEDPGRSLGPRGPAHRFFFAPDEVEVLLPRDDESAGAQPVRVLVAGIGNIFLGDDGFGVEVVQRLARRSLPPGVQVVDFGIRGYDLAYALMAGHDRTILVDACPRGSEPGTVFVIEVDTQVDTQGPEGTADGQPVLDAHDMNPMHVLRLANSLGAAPAQVLVVGCEPATLGGDEGLMGLSPPVDAAVDVAVELIESLVVKLQAEGHASTSARA